MMMMMRPRLMIMLKMCVNNVNLFSCRFQPTAPSSTCESAAPQAAESILVDSTGVKSHADATGAEAKLGL
jgi:hypothetical protein